MENRSAIMKTKELYHDLSKKEALIAELVLKNPKRISRMPINEIADELGIASSTVFQFCRKLGYSGFRDFRNDLLSEEYDPQISVHEDVSPDDSAYAIATKVFSSSMKSLQDTCALLSESSLETAVSVILHTKKLSFFGVGGSNVVAYDAYHKFLRSPIPCQYGADYHIQLMQASMMTPEECAIITTHTGLTKNALELARIVKRTGSHLIVITGYPSSRIRELADVILVTNAQETGYRSESLSSRIAQLALIDSLFTIIMLNDEKKTKQTLHRIREVINMTKEEDV